MTTVDDNPVSAEHVSPESLGRVVRQAWVDYCIETGRTERPDHIAPWEELDEWSKEVDRRIGMAVATHAGNVSQCTWCGHVGTRNSVEMAAHILECVKHPVGEISRDLMAARARIQELEAELASMEYLDHEASLGAAQVTDELKRARARTKGADSLLRSAIDEHHPIHEWDVDELGAWAELTREWLAGASQRSPRLMKTGKAR